MDGSGQGFVGGVLVLVVGWRCIILRGMGVNKGVWEEEARRRRKNWIFKAFVGLVGGSKFRNRIRRVEIYRFPRSNRSICGMGHWVDPLRKYVALGVRWSSRPAAPLRMPKLKIGFWQDFFFWVRINFFWHFLLDL